jgi:hypothetical protein
VGLAPTGKRRLVTAHANNGHSGKPTKRLSLYATSEQATRSSHLASSAITNEMFAKEPNDARVSRLCGEPRYFVRRVHKKAPQKRGAYS